MNRRLFVATAATAALGSTAGCLDLFDDLTAFAASPAIVDPEQADAAGYEYQGTEETVETEQVPGTDETVEVTNYISEYTRTIEIPLDIIEVDGVDTGVFGIITTPQVTVAGEEYNPVGDMSNAEIAETIQDQYEELELGDSVDERTTDGLGETITVETFEAQATFQGQDGVDIFVDVAQLDHGDDHLVIVAIYPDVESLPITDEEARVDTMIGGLVHGDDVDADIESAEGTG